MCAKSHKASYYYPGMDCDGKFSPDCLENRDFKHAAAIQLNCLKWELAGKLEENIKGYSRGNCPS